MRVDIYVWLCFATFVSLIIYLTCLLARRRGFIDGDTFSVVMQETLMFSFRALWCLHLAVVSCSLGFLFFFLFETIAPKKEILGFQKWHLTFQSFISVSNTRGRAMERRHFHLNVSPTPTHSKIILITHYFPRGEIMSKGDFHFIYCISMSCLTTLYNFNIYRNIFYLYILHFTHFLEYSRYTFISIFLVPLNNENSGRDF